MPEALASATMTLTRPAVGAGAALAAYVIAEAGFLKLDTTVMKDGLAALAGQLPPRVERLGAC